MTQELKVKWGEKLPEGWRVEVTLLDENDKVTKDESKAVVCHYEIYDENGKMIEHGIAFPKDLVR